MSFATLFFPVCALSYSVSVFCGAENFNFNDVQLINSFMDGAFSGVFKNVSTNPRLSRFSPMLSSQSFTFLCFTLRSVIYFDLDCIKCIRFVIRIFFF